MSFHLLSHDFEHFMKHSDYQVRYPLKIYKFLIYAVY